MGTFTAKPAFKSSDEPAIARRVTSRRVGRLRWVLLLLAGLLCAAFLVSLFVGSVSIPPQQVMTALFGGETTRASWATIVQDYRLPKALTALLAGAGLAVAGLLMQTLFRNPLADTYVLGIGSGASLGVALVVLTAGVGTTTLMGALGLAGDAAIIVAATLGAGAALAVVLLVARRVQSAPTLLIIGLMFGYMTSAVVSILAHFTIPNRLQAYTNWTQGTFGDVTWSQMGLFAAAILFGLGMSFISGKPLNALLMGEDFARTLGVNVRRARWVILIAAAILAGTATAFCGPIAFLGIAVPQICRALLRISDHRWLLPASALCGAALALAADVIAQAPGSQTILPLNAVMALFGAPIVIWVILQRSNLRSGI